MEIPELMQANIVWSSIIAGGIGMPGAFLAHADIPALTVIWVRLLIKLSKLAGDKIDNAKATKIAAGVLAGVGTLVGGVKLGSTLFAWTGVGTVPAILVNASANATVTYLFGRSVAKIFLSHGPHDSVAEMVKAIITVMVGTVPGDSHS